jgi:molybdopterin molybdotransferase
MNNQILLPPHVALQTALAAVVPLPPHGCAIDQVGPAFAVAPILADIDQPPFDRSAMDGFALRIQDLREHGLRLPCAATVLAGQPLLEPVPQGACVRIMTGAAVPAGLDAVVPIELAVVEVRAGSQIIEFTHEPRLDQHIARKGSEVRAGAQVIAVGDAWTPARVGVAASFGAAQVLTRGPVRVGLVATGDEIVPVGQTPGPGQIRDSNRYALQALLCRYGAQVTVYPTAPDTAEGLANLLEIAWRDSDFLITTGGVSAGDLDLVAPTVTRLGATTHFHKIAIKPGKPLLFATLGGKPMLGLPGNPVSALVCAVLFAVPLLQRLRGAESPQWQTVQLPLAHSVSPVGPRLEVQPVRLLASAAGTTVAMLESKGSADLPGYARADAWALRPAGDAARSAGDRVDVLWWPRPD